MSTVEGDLQRFVAALWTKAGTDLLLTAGAPPFIRVDGELRRLEGEAVLTEEAISALLVSHFDRHQRNRFKHSDVEFVLSWGNKARLRGSAFRQRGSSALAMRILPGHIPSFDELGIPTAVRELATLTQGLVLFTGPTGSGKSTSQACLIDWINENRQCHVLTIEDPIEYLHGHKSSAVNQREIGTDVDSFSQGLRSALREDPDVILVGEMRDPESIGIALTLAETGHLVISTLHTNDAPQALDRIVDVFPGDRQDQIRLQLASSLSAAIAQRLVPRVGGGMVAAFEVLLGSHAARNLVREGKTRQLRNVISTSQADGMVTLEMSLAMLVHSGIVSYDDAVDRALVPNEIPAPPWSMQSGARPSAAQS